MSTVKSFAIGNGDMFYINHNSDNFTVIDCSIPDDRRANILADVSIKAKAKGNTRFISTHPDQDHLSGLTDLDDVLSLRNFYCVANKATKTEPTEDFERYCELRDSNKAFHISKGCSRKWMNQSDDRRKSSGIEVLWPDTGNALYKAALVDAESAQSPNNTSCIIRYSLHRGASMLWMGDLETEFMEAIQDEVVLQETDVLFAPHHGRDSGKVPQAWLTAIAPKVIVIGEAPSEYLDYYDGYNILTQNSCGDILLDNSTGRTDIYVGDHAYAVDFLDDEALDHKDGLYYLGSFSTHQS